MRPWRRSPLLSLGAFALSATIVGLVACAPPGPEAADAPAASGITYLIDSCPGAADGPLWVLPRTPNSNLACQTDLRVEVEGVAGTGAGGGSCSIAASGSSPFKLSWDSTGTDATATITAPASKLYVTSTTDRQQLAQNFLGFRQALVKLQTGGSSCLLPGGAELLSERLAQGMPLPLDEVPLYRYGYDPSQSAVELRPGMRVRLVNSGLFDENTSASPTLTSAFTGTGTATIAVSSGPLGTDPTKLPDLSLSPFLSPFGLQVGISSGSWKPVKSVRYAASVLDLVSAGDAEPYLGLVYSPSSSKVPPIDQPTVDLDENPVLVWAQTPEDLASQIELLSAGATSEACGTKGVCTVLYGRAALVPEIQVTVNLQPVWVPVGTTLRQVIAATRDWTGPDTTPTGALQTLLWRIVPPTSQGQTAGLAQVTFPRAQGNFNASATLRPSAFDVPLVRGDQIVLGQSPNSGTAGAR